MSAPALPVTDILSRPRMAEAAVSGLEPIEGLMRAAASLKLTVGLFAYAIWIVLIGTLAQTDADIWQVVRDYFHSWLMWVDVNLLFPKSFFPHMPHLSVPLIPMPGGLVVGTLMIVNLLSAHLWRFKMQARGTRLIAGLVVTAVGLGLTTLIILAGHNSGGFQALPPFTWHTMWLGIEALLGVTWVVVAMAFAKTMLLPLWSYKTPGTGVTVLRLVLSLLGIVFLALVGFTLTASVLRGWSIGDEALRVLWQLVQGGLAGVVLLVGCILLFNKRAGIVLLHSGVLLMMANELLVAHFAIEWQVFLSEGQTTNFVRDIRTVELAFIDRSASETDEHIVIPRAILQANFLANTSTNEIFFWNELERAEANLQKQQASGASQQETEVLRSKIDTLKKLVKGKQKPPLVYIEHPLLPVKVAVLEYYKNADVENRVPEDKLPATAGAGLSKKIVERPAAKGTDSDSGVDLAAAYVKLADKKTDKDLGTYLVSQLASEQIGADRQPERFGESVTAGDKTYYAFLRFQRHYKPYTIKLLDVRKDDYVASDTPRNYSSDIQLKDEKNGVDKPVHIKMNNPLRYAGETFYQSGYHAPATTGGAEATTLAVVRNTGWMIPYVGCMVVAIGMLAHFLITVTRFIGRKESEEIAAGDVVLAELTDEQVPARGRKAKKAAQREPRSGWDWASISLSILAAGIFTAYLGSAARVPPLKSGEVDIGAFGQLPVAHLGRVKPLDTLARNTLRAISHRETVKVEVPAETDKKSDGDSSTKAEEKQTKTLSAAQWLLEVISGTEQANKYHVIRIDSPEVRQIFELPERKGFLYSVEELQPHIERFEAEVDAIRKLKPEDLSNEQRRVHELDEGLKVYITVVQAFSPPPGLPKVPTAEALKKDPQLLEEFKTAFGAALRRSAEQMKMTKAPRAIPTEAKADAAPDDVWKPYPIAWAIAYVQYAFGQEEPDAATLKFESILSAYRKGDAKDFNVEVARYRAYLEKTAPPLWNEKKANLEAYFNHVSPFYVGIPLYAMAFLLAMFGWLFRYRPLNWAAFTMALCTLGLHTAALILRIYISGRPPVTNLYSAAVFIGWGCVLFGLIIELIYRNGLGNIVSAIAGFATLIIAYFLAAGGDTITVLQAVLDTQFWLATHVTCITMGYTATYVAGLFGLLYVICGLCTPLLDQKMRKDLARMIYGVLCFAMFFSFVGTVLGGLWADDSWGRFWGWDPKENGALIIVLWNALVLHAKWDKLVADRGLAVLAIGGNIVTSWSFFGVNELGIGLHAYGFTEGVLLALLLFIASQLVVIFAGCLPKSLWWSYQADRDRVGLEANT